WKPPAHSPEENMVRQKCSGIRRSYLARNSEQTSLRIIVLGLITLSLVMLSSLSKDISLPYQQEKTIISTPPQGFYTI
ncbi:hypothetical protein, partial [Citrobacter freundii]|uniref:hypothetical protein n=1 Tax=Citrobacter freundii TaxID=546 RepID=UPI001BCB3017